MDKVKSLIQSNGIQFQLGLEETFKSMYEPLYIEPAPGLVEVEKDIAFGSHERQMLDVYYPSTPLYASSPVLVYMHGGGFFSGDKRWSEKVYANVGNYYALKGIVVVIPNHHLIPDAKYPEGSIDIQLAREWVYENISKYGNGDKNKVILWGHSSGGAHLASNLFAAGDPNFATQDPLFPPVAGVAIFSCPWWYDVSRPLRNKNIAHYYGSADEKVWEPVSPLGLFKRIPADSPVLDTSRLTIYLGTVKYETVEATEGLLAFFNEYRAKSTPESSLPLINVVDNHNHLSNVLSIGTADEVQALELLKFVLASVDKIDSKSRIPKSRL